MFGNPYAFKIFTKQEIKYLLSQWPENTVGLQVCLYQDGNFKYYDESISGGLQNYTSTSVPGVGSLINIRVSDV
jgi:hypothetical protein